MTTSYAEIDNLLVLIDVDDPAVSDPEFSNYLKYGGFVKECPDFTDENKEAARRSEGKLTSGKFIIELYADRFQDFMYTCTQSNTHYRAVIFRCLNINPFDGDEDLEEIQFIYELRTVGKRGARDIEDSIDDDEIEEEHDSEQGSGFDAAACHAAPKILH